MTKLHVSDLNHLIDTIHQCGGNFQHPHIVQKFLPLELEYTMVVDDANLSPYSKEHYQQRIFLYEEVSGRKLNQADGELHPTDIESLFGQPNPIGILDVAQMSEHVRAVSKMISIAGLVGQAKVLDMGTGHGIASEVMAFMGCRVHAIDIDPVLGELSRRRAAARGLQIERSILNFDDLSSIEDAHYAGAFFSQSLHRCFRPWELIERLKAKIDPEQGVIAFVGEPINDFWWKNWGLRLDEVSLFVARSHGWFESGWTFDFITDCFERNGFKLDMFKGGFAGGDIGIATMSATKRDAVLAQASTVGAVHNVALPKTDSEGEVLIDPARCLTQVVQKKVLHGRPAFCQQGNQPGMLTYGPYVKLEPGTYEFVTLIQHQSYGKIGLDIACNLGETILFKMEVRGVGTTGPILATGQFSLTEQVEDVEIRLAIVSGEGWKASLPTIRRV
jgi:hypothetical protein